MFVKKGIRLYVLITALILFIMLITVTINWRISMKTYEKSLADNYLNSNYSYAKKLKDSTAYQLEYMQKNIIAIGKIADDDAIDQDDFETWYAANSDQFNSIFTTDKHGVVDLISPSSIQKHKKGKVITKGTKLKTDTMKKALAERKPLISEPYFGTSGQLITLISAPIFDQDTGEYKGVAGGTIYMEDTNVLKSILATHETDNHSYVYVVDAEGKLIYHPDKDRLGEDVSANKVVQKVLEKKNGSSVVTNTKGEEFFAGYSNVKSTGWGVVVQTPTTIVDELVKSLFWRMAIISIPFLLVILIVGGILVKAITGPLNKLARFSESVQRGDQEVEVLNMHSPIYEVRQLYFQLIDHLRTLNKQVKIDGLTELANRRTFDIVMDVWIKEKIPFSLIMLDIDHFKKINDTYGHLQGDEVLKHLSGQMTDAFSTDDLCFRYGGEEFGVLMKNAGELEAYEKAEKLRNLIAESENPTGEGITVSLGVTSHQLHENDDVKALVCRADTALYNSKRTGRNKTTLYKKDS